MAGALQAYKLCRLCSEREEMDALSFTLVPGAECTLCSGLMDRLEEMGGLALKRLRLYEFRTFSVGVSLPDGVQEREDELRSDLKLKGRETIKTQASRAVASRVSRSTRKRLDKKSPDVTVLADFGEGDVYVTSKPVFYYGRYTKPRGIAQRRTFCEECRGSGCDRCHGTGYERRPSVEDVLRGKLSGFAGSDKVVLTWLGSEDEESRVLPPGRPFVAEIKSPKKRKLPRKFGVRVRKSVVYVTAGRVLPSKPVGFP